MGSGEWERLACVTTQTPAGSSNKPAHTCLPCSLTGIRLHHCGGINDGVGGAGPGGRVISYEYDLTTLRLYPSHALRIEQTPTTSRHAAISGASCCFCGQRLGIKWLMTRRTRASGQQSLPDLLQVPATLDLATTHRDLPFPFGPARSPAKSTSVSAATCSYNQPDNSEIAHQQQCGRRRSEALCVSSEAPGPREEKT